MPPQATFHSVWYRDHEKGVAELLVPFLTFAHMHCGTLTLRRGRMDYVGSLRLAITGIRRVTLGKCGGIDLLVNWVRIDYDDDLGRPRVAYFADGNVLGWSGVFGGTYRLLEAIETLVLAPPLAEVLEDIPDVLPPDADTDIPEVIRVEGPTGIRPPRDG